MSSLLSTISIGLCMVYVYRIYCNKWEKRIFLWYLGWKLWMTTTNVKIAKTEKIKLGNQLQVVWVDPPRCRQISDSEEDKGHTFNGQRIQRIHLTCSLERVAKERNFHRWNLNDFLNIVEVMQCKPWSTCHHHHHHQDETRWGIWDLYQCSSSAWSFATSFTQRTVPVLHPLFPLGIIPS